MSTTNEALVGHVVEVRGDGFTANLLADEQESPPKVTIGDEDILVGQLGSYVCVHQGPIKILCLVTRMAEQEKLADANTATPGAPVLTPALVGRRSERGASRDRAPRLGRGRAGSSHQRLPLPRPLPRLRGA